MAKLKDAKELKDAKKNKLEEENKNLSDKIESLLYVMKQEECNIQNFKQKETLLQKSIEDILGFMSICDWTLQHDLTRSRLAAYWEKLNPTLKGLIERDSAKIDKARQTFKESLVSMKRVFEKTEEVGAVLTKHLKDTMKEDAECSKQLVEKYPELKVLYEMKPSYIIDDNQLSPSKDSYISGVQPSES